jgi:hypothetical protein
MELFKKAPATQENTQWYPYMSAVLCQRTSSWFPAVLLELF